MWQMLHRLYILQCLHARSRKQFHYPFLSPEDVEVLLLHILSEDCYRSRESTDAEHACSQFRQQDARQRIEGSFHPE